MMRKRMATLALAAMVFAGVSSAAHAQVPVDGGGGSAPVTATVVDVGLRYVAAVGPVVLSGGQSATANLPNWAVQVLEVNRTGTNPWSVTAVSSNLVNTIDATKVITANNLSVSNRAVVSLETLGALAPLAQFKSVSTAVPSGSAALNAPAQLFSVAGQNSGSLYINTYTSAATVSLSVPAGTPTGVYAGTITVTLVQ
jgi:hypothetical protein